MKRFRFMFPIAVAAALTALGCGGSFIGGSSSTVLNGTWTLDSMTVNGTTQTCPASAAVTSTATVTCSRFSDTFNTDGTVNRKSSDGVTTANGKYTYNGTVLTIAFGNDDHQVPISFNTGSTAFTTTQNIFGYTVTYSYTKNP